MNQSYKNTTMPELPEVENTVLSLKNCETKQIIDVYTSGKNLRVAINNNLKELINNSIINTISRVGKYIVFYLNNQYVLLIHLGMSGRFILSKSNMIDKHDHVVLYLNDGNTLKLNDPRRFGMFVAEYHDLLPNILKKIGVDALSEDFNDQYLYSVTKLSTVNIKTLLLNQKIVAGIGNIYASESLYYAGINPFREVKSLSANEIHYLVNSIKDVLRKAIHLGGSTLRDYKKATGESGSFQKHFAVYGKNNQNCPKCTKNACIIKVVQSGRSTFYCQTTQK